MQDRCQRHRLDSVSVQPLEVSGLWAGVEYLLNCSWERRWPVWRGLICASALSGTLLPVPTDIYRQAMSRAISLEAATSVTQLSKRTLWRRLSEGQITRQANDEDGRAMLTFEDLVPMLCIPIAPEDHRLIIEAAAGDAEAQTDLALLFLDADKPGIGLSWLNLAADQGYPDAMHHLSRLYIQGNGPQKNDSLGLMWLAKAASLGHVIAGEQVTALARIGKV